VLEAAWLVLMKGGTPMKTSRRAVVGAVIVGTGWALYVVRGAADEIAPPPGGREVSMSAKQTSAGTQASKKGVRPHQLGQDVFKATQPEDIDWKPFPALPPSVRLAVIVGKPSEAAPYVVRVEVPRDVKLMPHKHPEDRVYTVISGVFYIGLGDRFDPAKLQAYPPGSVIVLPGNTPHFHWAKSGEYVTQVNAIGPLGIEYVNPSDDPRNGNGER
jgi:quercetin dioxygenase-like cupin family protein